MTICAENWGTERTFLLSENKVDEGLDAAERQQENGCLNTVLTLHIGLLLG